MAACHWDYQTNPVPEIPLWVPLHHAVVHANNAHTLSASPLFLNSCAYPDRSLSFLPSNRFHSPFFNTYQTEEKSTLIEQHCLRSAWVCDLRVTSSSLAGQEGPEHEPRRPDISSVEALQSADAPFVWGMFWSTWWMTCADAQALSDWGRLSTHTIHLELLGSPSRNVATGAMCEMDKCRPDMLHHLKYLLFLL